LDIQFALKDGNEVLFCTFESDAYYVQGVRYKGDHRRFIGIEGSEEICNFLHDEFMSIYSKEELIDLVHFLSEYFEISLV